MAALLAALIALALVTPADARRRTPPHRKAAPQTVCVPYHEPGVGNALVCAQAPRSSY